MGQLLGQGQNIRFNSTGLDHIDEQLEKYSIVLGYWNCRGQCQSIRCFLTYLNVNFQDIKYEEWSEFEEPKNWPYDGKFMGLLSYDLPYLVDRQHRITGQFQIFEYICDLYSPISRGKDEQDKVEVLNYTYMLKRLDQIYQTVAYSQYINQDYINDFLAQLKKVFHVLIARNQRFKWACTKKQPSFIDFVLNEWIQVAEALDLNHQITNFTDLSNYRQNFEKLERVQEFYYLSQNLPYLRPRANFQVNDNNYQKMNLNPSNTDYNISLSNISKTHTVQSSINFSHIPGGEHMRNFSETSQIGDILNLQTDIDHLIKQLTRSINLHISQNFGASRDPYFYLPEETDDFRLDQKIKLCKDLVDNLCQSMDQSIDLYRRSSFNNQGGITQPRQQKLLVTKTKGQGNILQLLLQSKNKPIELTGQQVTELAGLLISAIRDSNANQLMRVLLTEQEKTFQATQKLMDKKRKYSIIQDEFDSLKDANYLLHADNKVKSDQINQLLIQVNQLKDELKYRESMCKEVSDELVQARKQLQMLLTGRDSVVDLEYSASTQFDNQIALEAILSDHKELKIYNCKETATKQYSQDDLVTIKKYGSDYSFNNRN